MPSWEEGDWPVSAVKEIQAAHFEDLRRMVWLATYWNVAGLSDIYTDAFIYNHENWDNAIRPIRAHPSPPPDDIPSSPGDVVIWFKNPITGQVIRYVNYDHAYADAPELGTYNQYAKPAEWKVFDVYAKSGLEWANCPINKDGSLNDHWKPACDPNKYHHWNFNSGRWDCRHYSGNSQFPFSGYDVKLPAHRWLPQQVDSLEQIAPRGDVQMLPRDAPACTCQCERVEIKKNHITQELGTRPVEHTTDGDWARCLGPNYYPMVTNDYKGTWPLQYSPYYPHEGHPFDKRLDDLGIEQYRWSRRMGGDSLVQAYQDAVVICLERQGYSRFVWEVNSEWIAQWSKRMQEWESSAWELPTAYTEGDVVSNNSIYYICYVAHAGGDAAKEPGVGGSWPEYWLEGIHHPEYFGTHPEYVSLANECWNCNSSAFEFVLKQMGSYDWWWDDETPPISNLTTPTEIFSVYHRRWVELKEGDPHPEWFPKPVGCWRRTWKYSMGKVKKADGTDAVMWPAELGNPNTYFGITEGQMIVTQADYDAALAGVKNMYQVIYVDAMIAEVGKLLGNYDYDKWKEGEEYNASKKVIYKFWVYKARLAHTSETENAPTGTKTPNAYWEWVPEYRGKIEERHGPVQTTDMPEYELRVEIMNDMHTALEYLKHIKAQDLVDVKMYPYGYACHNNEPGWTVPLAAVLAGRDRMSHAEYKNRRVEQADYVKCGYHMGKIRHPGDGLYYPVVNNELSATGEEEVIQQFSLLVMVGKEGTEYALTNGQASQAISGDIPFVSRIPCAHSTTDYPDGELKVGDNVILNAVLPYNGRFTIVNIPDKAHFDILVYNSNQVAKVFDANDTAVQFVGPGLFPKGMQLRVSYYGVTGTNRDVCKLGVLDSYLDPIDNVPRVKYLGTVVPGVDESPLVFYIDWVSPWPTEDNPVARAHLSQTSGLGVAHKWLRQTGVNVSGVDPFEQDIHNWIVAEIDWDQTIAQFGSVFIQDCSNAVAVEE